LFFLVIDTTAHECRPPSPVLNRPLRSSKVDDNPMILFESAKEETAAYDAEEQTHNLIGEIIRKRSRKTSLNQTADVPSDSYCDSDRISLLSVDMNTSSTNLNALTSNPKI
jgi:hypothetical protein